MKKKKKYFFQINLVDTSSNTGILSMEVFGMDDL